jgi:hypothetical protein
MDERSARLVQQVDLTNDEYEEVRSPGEIVELSDPRAAS